MPYQDDDNIEKMLREEQREQKRTGYGIHNRASRRGTVGVMWFPHTLMSKKDRKEYMKASELRVSVTYENSIIPYGEFLQLTDEKKTEALTLWREKFETKQILEAWHMTKASFYKIARGLGVEINQPRSGRKPGKRQQSISAPATPIAPPTSIKDDGMFITLSGTYDGETLVERLMKLSGLLEKEQARYTIKLTVSEA